MNENLGGLLSSIIVRGIHYADDSKLKDGIIIGLCGADGAFGSENFVNCPKCLELLKERREKS